MPARASSATAVRSACAAGVSGSPAIRRKATRSGARPGKGADGRQHSRQGRAGHGDFPGQTNTTQEKAAMIAATRDMLLRVLPELSAVAYVVIDEIPATDWGYGGLTQAARKRRADAA
mgnify:CR=1 FL=1